MSISNAIGDPLFTKLKAICMDIVAIVAVGDIFMPILSDPFAQKLLQTQLSQKLVFICLPWETVYFPMAGIYFHNSPGRHGSGGGAPRKFLENTGVFGASENNFSNKV